MGREPLTRLPVFEGLEGRERLLRAAWERLDPKFRTANQVLGRRSTVGCVALEITQRCNLDCTLCNLSRSSAPPASTTPAGTTTSCALSRAGGFHRFGAKPLQRDND